MMIKGAFSRCLLVVAVVFMAVVVGRATAAIQCNEAVTQVLPCEAYLLSGDAAPSAACCSAVSSLDKIALASQGDRRAICKCFKETARSFPVNPAKAQKLPQLCHITLGMAVDPNVDCDKI